MGLPIRALSAAAVFIYAQSDEVCTNGVDCDEDTSLMQDLVKRGASRNKLSLNAVDLTSKSGRHDSMTKLMETATRMIKNGVTPDVVSFVDGTLGEITTTVLPAIQDEHTTDQGLINTLLDQYQATVDRLNADRERVEALHANRLTESTTHKECRSTEGGLCAHSRRCEEELEQLWMVVEREEATMRGIHTEIHDEWCIHPPGLDAALVNNPFDWASISPYPLLDLAEDVRDFRSVSVTEFTEYLAQKPVVERAWVAYNEKIVECARKESELYTQVGSCDANQITMEEGACAHAEQTREIRRTFGHAWREVGRSYNDAVAAITELEVDRKREWETLHIVMCLLGAVHDNVETSIATGGPCPTEDSDPEETRRSIDGCHVVTETMTEHLTIDYGNPPVEPPLPAVIQPACTPEYIAEEQTNFPVSLRTDYSTSIAGMESFLTVLSPHGWPGCAAPRICIPCAGMEPSEPIAEFTDMAVECAAHEVYLLPGQGNPDTFRCSDGTCIEVGGRCNGHNNCVDGSDETGCSKPWGKPAYLASSSECPADLALEVGSFDDVFFRCGDGSCTRVSGRCNGENNCPDGSDEQRCECGTTVAVEAEAYSGRQATVEHGFSMNTGVFHDRDYALGSLGSFGGKTFIKISNADKSTESDHVMMKLRSSEPVTVYVNKLADQQEWPWLAAQGWQISSGQTGVTYSGPRTTPHTEWSGEITIESYGPGEVWEKTFEAGTVTIPGGNDGSFLVFLEKRCGDVTAAPAAPAATWHLAMNINPSDGHDFGWGYDWEGNDDVGSEANALTADYVSSTHWAVPYSHILIARHRDGQCDALRVWRFSSDQMTMQQHFQSYDPGRQHVTVGGPIHEVVPDDLPGRSVDPMFGVGGDLVFNWWYGNNGARIALDGGHLSCDACNDDDTHGLGNEFGASVRDGSGSESWTHDASAIQGDCHGGSCTIIGTDHGSSLQDGTDYGQYAIFLSNDEIPFQCDGAMMPGAPSGNPMLRSRRMWG